MFIVGAGRVGGALVRRARQAQVSCVQVTRTEGWEAIASSAAPIFVAVRNDDLEAVVNRVPAEARPRLVFTQNGMLRPWLASRGLDGCTRGLLFFAVPSRGAELQPGAESPFVGPAARAVCQWLDGVGVPANVASAERFAILELEKLVWNSAFGLLCEYARASVGDVVAEHGPLLRDLVEELLELGASALGLSLDGAERAALYERLKAYSRSIPSYRGAVKEWRWRNGWFVERARQVGCEGEHERLLRITGHLVQETDESAG